MAVKFTKPEINVREKLAELDKPSGIAGEAMLRAETPQEQFNLIGAGRRNLLINGNLQVSQRGTYTSATTSSNAYFLDRWKVDRNGTATLQHTTGHDIPGTPAICKAVKFVQTVTGNNYLGMRQRIENPSIYAGRTFTYSAWIRSNTPNARIECYAPGTTPNLYIGPNHSGNGEWEYLSFTFTLNPGTPTAFLADVFIDSGAYGNTTITAGEYFEVTMLQVETGKVATPFEHRSYGEELALCQRYYFKVGGAGNGTTTNIITGGVEGSGGAAVGGLAFPTTMRAVPTISTANLNFWAFTGGGSSFTVGTNRCTKEVGAFVVGGISNRAGGQAGVCYKINDNGYLAFDAEL